MMVWVCKEQGEVEQQAWPRWLTPEWMMVAVRPDNNGHDDDGVQLNMMATPWQGDLITISCTRQRQHGE